MPDEMKSRFTARDVLDQLDADARQKAAFFPDLDHGYNYHVDGRLTAYGDPGRWVIVIEQLSVNPRAGCGVGGTAVHLHFHGDYSIDHPQPGWGDKPVITIETITDGPNLPLLQKDSCQEVNLSATEVCIRDRIVPINTNPNYYWARKIDVESIAHEQIDKWIANARKYLRGDQVRTKIERYEEMRSRVGAFELNTWHLLRGRVPEYRDGLLSTDTERRCGVPGDLPRLLQIEEWVHPHLMDGELPSGCESFKLIAKVLATGDPIHYRPTEEPNTHWSNWPLSGSL
jgi:hypothetical protein